MSTFRSRLSLPAYLAFVGLMCTGWTLLCACYALRGALEGWDKYREDLEQSFLGWPLRRLTR